MADGIQTAGAANGTGGTSDNHLPADLLAVTIAGAPPATASTDPLDHAIAVAVITATMLRRSGYETAADELGEWALGAAATYGRDVSAVAARLGIDLEETA